MATTTKADQALDTQAPVDRVAASRARAQAFVDGSKEQTGTVLGLSDGCIPYWFVPSEVGDGRAESMRRDLLARGYDPNPQANVAGIGQAEVWELPEEAAAVLAVARLKRDRKALGIAQV